jgi:hypothetical protein
MIKTMDYENKGALIPWAVGAKHLEMLRPYNYLWSKKWR